MPVSRMASIRSDVPTGRSMKMRDGFTRSSSWQARPGSSASSAVRCALWLLAPAALALSLAGTLGGRARGAGSLLPQQHLGTVLELVGAVDDHGLPGLEPLRDGHVGGVARTQGELAHAHRLVGIDHISVGAGCAALYAGLRNERGAVQRIQQQYDVHELLRKEALVGVGKDRLQLD